MYLLINMNIPAMILLKKIVEETEERFPCKAELNDLDTIDRNSLDNPFTKSRLKLDTSRITSSRRNRPCASR